MKKVLAILIAVVVLVLSGCSAGSKLERGTVENGVYISEYSGLTFSPAEGWEFWSDEDILKLIEATEGRMSESEREKYDQGKGKTVYDAIASSGSASVFIIYENLALTKYGTNYTESDYAEVLSTLLSGYTISDPEELTIGGNTYLSVTATATVEEDTILCQQYLLRRIDNYMLSILITTYPEYTVSSEEIISWFE